MKTEGFYISKWLRFAAARTESRKTMNPRDYDRFAVFYRQTNIMNQTVIYEITAVVKAELSKRMHIYARGGTIPDCCDKIVSRGVFTRTLENRYRIQYHARNEEF